MTHRLALGTTLALAGALALPPLGAATAVEGFADIVEAVGPAVVTVTATREVPAGQMAGMPDRPSMPDGPFGLPEGSPFRDYFRHYFEQQRPGGKPRMGTALGSGFIIDPDG
ncbi:MAG: DegQ family serine endoprotease, partial [Alphaproteobacteria bacterium]